jgi:multicomponent Na+:H+ antiporter subunit E
MATPSQQSRRKSENRGFSSLRLYLLTALALSLLWLAFSGKLDPVHLSYGAVSVLLVLWLSRRLVVRPEGPRDAKMVSALRLGPAIAYPFWLAWQILLANLQVAWIVINPRMPIDPVLLRFRCGMKDDLSRVVLGNSITLTPGTFTLRITDDEFLVHAIHPGLAQGLLDGSMQRRVASVFGEEMLAREEMRLEIIRDMNAFMEEEA